jgi:hypothetical protein
MKKRILLIGIILTLILTLVFSSTAYAKQDNDKCKFGTGSFSAAAWVQISDAGKTTSIPTPTGLMIITTGEIMLSSPITSEYCDWPLLYGATLKVTHSSVITLFSNFTFSGKAANNIQVTLADGSTLSGFSPTEVTGTYSLQLNPLTNKYYPVYETAGDAGYFNVSGSVNKVHVSAYGSLNATLSRNGEPPDYTLVGPLNFDGDYIILK